MYNIVFEDGDGIILRSGKRIWWSADVDYMISEFGEDIPYVDVFNVVAYDENSDQNIWSSLSQQEQNEILDISTDLFLSMEKNDYYTMY